MPSELEILRRFLRVSKRDALREKWDLRRRELLEIELRKKLQSTLGRPPNVLMVEKVSCDCPNCFNIVRTDDIPANMVTCPHCGVSFQILAWFKPRKPGRTELLGRVLHLFDIKKLRLAETEPEGISPDEMVRTSFLRIDRAVFQCINCGHYSVVRMRYRNRWQCTKCKRRWEVTIRLQGLSVDAPSSENFSAQDQEAALQPIESLPESTPGLFAI